MCIFGHCTSLVQAWFNMAPCVCVCVANDLLFAVHILHVVVMCRRKAIGCSLSISKTCSIPPYRIGGRKAGAPKRASSISFTDNRYPASRISIKYTFSES